MRLPAGSLVLLLVGIGASARAETTPRRHVFVGVVGAGRVVVAQRTGYRQGYLGNGGGGGVVVGVRAQRWLSLDAELLTAVHAQRLAAARVTTLPIAGAALARASLGVRVHWPSGGRLEPYAGARLGLAATFLDFVDCPDCDRLFATGPAAELRGGVELALGRRLALGVSGGAELMHFAGDAFERRLRQAGFERSHTPTTIVSIAVGLDATAHF
jgi:hypothetical protein